MAGSPVSVQDLWWVIEACFDIHGVRAASTDSAMLPHTNFPGRVSLDSDAGKPRSAMVQP